MLVYDLLPTTFLILCRPLTTLHGTSKYVALRLHSAGGMTCSMASEDSRRNQDLSSQGEGPDSGGKTQRGILAVRHP